MMTKKMGDDRKGQTRFPSRERLLQVIERFSGRRLLIVGDFMLDHFIRGKVERISPEAPVPVVQVAHEDYVPGGAGNVAANLSALGAKVSVLGMVGDDEAGRTLRSDLNARGVDTSLFLTDGRPTTVKVRVIAEHQQVVRFDRERRGPLPKTLRAQALGALKAALEQTDGLILSDYGKGMLEPEVLSAAIAAARRRGIPVVVDPKVEHFKKYKRVSCITPNLAEAWGGMHLPPKSDEASVTALGRKIISTLQAQSVLITRGAAGMSLFVDGKVTTIPTAAREVFDVTGAGDTVISVLTLALAGGATPLEAAVVSNFAAGIVVAKLGTATVSPEELKSAVKRAAK